MEATTVIAIVAAGIAIILTPVWLFLVWKGVRSLADISALLRRPPRSRE